MSRASFAMLVGVALTAPAEGLVAQSNPAASVATASRAEQSLRARLGGLKSVQVTIRSGSDGGAGLFDKKVVRAQIEATLRQAGIPISDGSADAGDDEGVLAVTVRTWNPNLTGSKAYVGLVGIELMRWGRTNSPAPIDMLIASWDAGPQLLAGEESAMGKRIGEMLQTMLDRFSAEFVKANPR